MKDIKRIAILTAAMAIMLSAMAFGPGPSNAGETVLVEIFYLHHRPAEAVVRDVEGVVSRFKGVTVRKYSFEDPAKRKLIEKYGLREHMPVAIFINGENEFSVDGRSVSLRNFPRGNSFVPVFEGSWTYEDVEAILSSALRGR